MKLLHTSKINLFFVLSLILAVGIYLANSYAKSLSDLTPSPQPIDVSTMIIDNLVNGGVDCGVDKTSCKVDKVEGNFAKGTMPQAYWIAEKHNTKWTIVISGNGIPTCTQIDKFSVPPQIYGNCIEPSGELRN
jgi:hypothetical protein